MKLLWTRSKLVGSRLMCWGLQEPCSHFCVAFDCNAEGTVGTVFQASFLGSDITYYGTFLKQHTIVHSIDIALSPKAEDDVYNAIVQKLDGMAYDYKYFSWMTAIVADKRLFGRPYPAKVPAWAKSPQHELCFQVFQSLPPAIVGLSNIDWDSFVTPNRLYQSINLPLLKNTNFVGLIT